MGGRGRWISEFEASLVYKVSSRTARATQRNPVSKKNKKQKQKQNKQTKKKTKLSYKAFMFEFTYKNHPFPSICKPHPFVNK